MSKEYTPYKKHTKKIKKLEEKVQELMSKDVIEIPEEFFTAAAVGCHYDTKDKKYKLVTIIYNHNTGAAKVTETVDAGDALHRAMFEINKHIHTKLKINEVK
jgi:hypothetical protein